MEVVLKRLELFTIVQKEFFRENKDFSRAWNKAMIDLAFSSSDFPYCGAALAKILLQVVGEKGDLKDYIFKSQDEDE